MATAAQMDEAVRNGEADAGYGETACSASVGNNTKFGKWYGMNCSAWCAMAVSKWYYDAGAPQPASSPKGFAYTPSGAAWYQAQKAWAGPGENPKRGWVVFFYSVSAGRIAHVGLVRGSRGSDGLIPTVEGNTNGYGSADGGGVLLKRRSPNQGISFRIAGYGIPGEATDTAAAEEWFDMPMDAQAKADVQAEVVKGVKKVFNVVEEVANPVGTTRNDGFIEWMYENGRAIKSWTVTTKIPTAKEIATEVVAQVPVAVGGSGEGVSVAALEEAFARVLARLVVTVEDETLPS